MAGDLDAPRVIAAGQKRELNVEPFRRERFACAIGPFDEDERVVGGLLDAQTRVAQERHDLARVLRAPPGRREQAGGVALVRLVRVADHGPRAVGGLAVHIEGDGTACRSQRHVRTRAQIEDEVVVVLQVAGKVRDRLTLKKDLPQAEVEAAALAAPKVAEILAGKAPRKIIVVPNKLVNVVP